MIFFIRGCCLFLLLFSFPISQAHSADKQSTPTAVSSPEMTLHERLIFEKNVRDYLLRNPEIIVEAMQILRNREQAQTRNQQTQTLAQLQSDIYEDPLAPVGGNPKGNVTIVEFFDYNCGYCKRVYPTVEKLLKSDGKIRYVYKEFPILGPSSVVAARAALAAWNLDQSKYEVFHAALMKSRGGLSEGKILRIATKSGFDEVKLKTAMKDPKIEAAIQKNHSIAQALKITGTPAFIIGNKIIPGAIDIDAMKKIIAEVRG
jgi:protein-disulfide isomerase